MDVEKSTKVLLRDDPAPKRKEDLYPLKAHYLFHGLGKISCYLLPASDPVKFCQLVSTRFCYLGL